MQPVETLALRAADGQALIGRWYAAEHPRGAAVIAGATAVPQRYYARFSQALAGAGFSTLTFDYRGVGESRGGSLRGSSATMSDWGARDLEAALVKARELAGGLPRFGICHSFGGQALGLAGSAARLDGVVTVGSQFGYIGHWPAPQRWGFRAQMGLAVPALTAAFGYLPGWSGIGEDLPSGVARVWARWCLSPGYLLDHVPGAAERYLALRCPAKVVAIADDAYAPLAAVEAFRRRLSGAELVRVEPAEVGLKRVGHFGFFRPGCAPLWGRLAGWLTGWAELAREGRSAAG